MKNNECKLCDNLAGEGVFFSQPSPFVIGKGTVEHEHI